MHDNLEQRLNAPQHAEDSPPPDAFTNAVQKSGRNFRIKLASAIITPIIIAAAALPILLNSTDRTRSGGIDPQQQAGHTNPFLFGNPDIDQMLMGLDAQGAASIRVSRRRRAPSYRIVSCGSHSSQPPAPISSATSMRQSAPAER